jgi:hypothetical protein
MKHSPLKLLTRTLLAAGLLLGTRASFLHAQAHPAASGPGSYVSVGYAFSDYWNPYGERNLQGYGVYVDVNPTWRYGIEAEGRTLKLNADEGVTLKNYLAGLKVAVLPGRFSPYGKFLVGAGHIQFPFQYASGTYFTYVPGGGIDFRLTDHISVRPVDFEYQMWQNFNYGTYRPYGISAGITIRLTPLSRLPKHAYYSR